MKDTDFEVDIAAAVREKTTLRFTREILEPVELKFETFSEGFSNVGLPEYTLEQEREFNKRYLEYLRELQPEVRNES